MSSGISKTPTRSTSTSTSTTASPTASASTPSISRTPVRSEQISVIDTRTGDVLDSRTISNFSNGRYISYDLTGGVTIQITRLSGPDAVLSGVFFDPSPTQSQDTVRVDPNTQGNYIPVYGSFGSIVVGDHTKLPGNLIYGVTGANEQVVTSSTTSKSAPVKLSDPSKAQVSYLTAPKQFNINLNFLDPTTHNTDPFTQHRVSLYAVDFDNKKRGEPHRSLRSQHRAALLAVQDVTSFSTGKYVTFDVQGNVSFHIINLAGPSRAVVSGASSSTPHPGSPAVFVSQDTNTKGSWLGKYGAAGSYVVGNSTGSPKFLGPIQATRRKPHPTCQARTSNSPSATAASSASATPPLSNSSRPAKETNSMDRIVAYLPWARPSPSTSTSTTSSPTASRSISSTPTTKRRSERLDIIDPKNRRPSSPAAPSPTSAKACTSLYTSITGPVRLKFTRLRGPNAVVSGVFFD